MTFIILRRIMIFFFGLFLSSRLLAQDLSQRRSNPTSIASEPEAFQFSKEFGREDSGLTSLIPKTAGEIFTEDKIQEKADSSVSESLRESSSLYLIGQEYSSPTGSVFLRGVKSEQSLLLWNGIEISDVASPTGSADPLDFNREFSDRIQILKGPQTLLFGASAIGGVISVEESNKLTPDDKASLHLQSDGRGFSKVKMEKPYREFRFGSSFLSSDNYSVARSGSEKDAHRKFSASAKWQSSSSDSDTSRSDLDASAVDFDKSKSKDAHSPLPGQLKVIASYMQNHSDDDQPPADDPNSYSDFRQTLLLGQYQIKHSDASTTILSLQGIAADRDNRNFADSISSSYYTSQTQSYRTKFQLQHQSGQIYQHRWTEFVGLDSDFAHIASENNYKSMSAFDQSRNQANVGVVWQAPYGLFQPSAGVRADCNGKCDGSFQLTAEHHVSVGTIYLMTGQGVKKPSLYQLYDPTYGNSNLKDEQGSQYELGWLHNFGSVSWDAAAFWYQFRDLQQFANFGSGSKYYNIGESYSRGIEVSAAHEQVYDQFKFSLSYTDAIDQSSNTALLRVPKWRSHGRWDRVFAAKLSGVIEFDYVGERFDYDISTIRQLPEYFLLHTSLRYKYTGLHEFFVRVNNLANQSYVEIWNYSTAGRVVLFGYQGWL